MVVRHIKVTFVSILALVVVLISTVKLNAQTTVEVYISTYYNGDFVASSQRTVNQGDALIYEVGDFPDADFLFWVVNGDFRFDLQQNITITVNDNTYLQIYFGNDTYYSGVILGYDNGLDIGYDNGFDDGFENAVSDVYYDGFVGFINPYTNEPYDVTYSFPYGQGYNDGVVSNDDYSFTGILFQVFNGLGALLTIELLPNITIGAIVAVPVVFGIIYFILGKRGGE